MDTRARRATYKQSKVAASPAMPSRTTPSNSLTEEAKENRNLATKAEGKKGKQGSTPTPAKVRKVLGELSAGEIQARSAHAGCEENREEGREERERVERGARRAVQAEVLHTAMGRSHEESTVPTLGSRSGRASGSPSKRQGLAAVVTTCADARARRQSRSNALPPR